MSFLDRCNKLFEKVNEKMQKLEEDISKYREMYEDLDDNVLIRYYKDSSLGARQLALAAILRERGYGTSDINKDGDEEF